MRLYMFKPIGPKGFLLIFLVTSIVIFLFGCRTLSSMADLNNKKDYFNQAFEPQKSIMKMDIPDQNIKKTEKMENDLYVVISEEAGKIIIYPYYRSSPKVGGMGFYIVTEEKNETGYLARVFDYDQNRIGYVWVQNKRYLNISIDLEKKNTYLHISFDCKNPEEYRDLNISDAIMLYTY